MNVRPSRPLSSPALEVCEILFGTGGQTTCDAGSPDAALDAGGADLPMRTSAPQNPIHSSWYPSNFASAGDLDAGADAGSVLAVI